MNKKIFLLTILLLVTSCSSLGNRRSPKLYEELNFDQLTTLDSLRRYGKPTRKWQDQNGNLVYQYYYTKSKYDVLSYIPIAVYFGSVKAVNYDILITFDKNNKIKEKRGFYTEFKTGNSYSCRQWADKCTKILKNETKN